MYIYISTVSYNNEKSKTKNAGHFMPKEKVIIQEKLDKNKIFRKRKRKRNHS